MVSTREIVFRFFYEQLERIQQKIPEIISDKDIEDLHQFRVAIRRTRSLLRQTKGIIPVAEIDHFNEGFKTIMQATNRMRDLDVFLEKKKEYSKLTPEYLKEGATLFFRELKQERDKELKSLQYYISESRVDEKLAEWTEYLNRSQEEVEKDKDSDVLIFSGKLIKKRLKQTDELKNKLDSDTDIHSLRIQFKKLRYILEFFSPYYPKKKILKCVHGIRELQNLFGLFNDLSIQQEFLKNYLRVSDGSGSSHICKGAAVGHLLCVLEEKQEEQRIRIRQQLNRNLPKLNRIIEKLLKFSTKSTEIKENGAENFKEPVSPKKLEKNKKEKKKNKK